jgi:hypothetical protein
MIIQRDPDEWVPDTSSTTCEFHKIHPRENFAGCTCSLSYSLRRATLEEYREKRTKRLHLEREKLIEDLKEIDRILDILKERGQ